MINKRALLPPLIILVIVLFSLGLVIGLTIAKWVGQ